MGTQTHTGDTDTYEDANSRHMHTSTRKPKTHLIPFCGGGGLVIYGNDHRNDHSNDHSNHHCVIGGGY